MTADHKRATSYEVLASNQEWRWVLSVSVVLLLGTSLPFFFAMWQSNAASDVVFMGLVYNPLDGASYFSKIQLGREGFWQTFFRHSPDADAGAYLDVMYTALGHFARLFGLSNVMVFHISRILTSFVMCLSLYQFAATVWRRTRNRQLYFVWVLVGSGFGWLFALVGVQNTPDLIVPEAFPLYSAMANAHFPLALAFVALSAGIIVRAFRPGVHQTPSLRNGGLLLAVFSLTLAIIAPHTLVTLAAALGLMIAIDWIVNREVQYWQAQWLLIVVIVAAPVALYYLAEVRYNPVVASWSSQNVTLTPPPWFYFPGFGIPLLFALPAIYRAVRDFEPDGDQFMLLWLLAIFIFVYIPVDPQRRFSIGAMIPITYFAVRTVENLSLPARWVRTAVSVSGLSYVLLLLLGFVVVSNQADPRFYLERDYVAAVEWIETTAGTNQLVLAHPSASLWLPGLAGARTVYAHPYETINADLNRQLVADWFAAEQPDAEICQDLITRYDVDYVVIGTLDNPPVACVAGLTEVETFGDVTLYAP